MSEAELDPLFEAARVEWFRLEGLASYRVSMEEPRFTAYLAGEPYDPAGEPAAWLAEIRRRVAGGLLFRKVRVMRSPPSEYERWECEWSYPATERAGQRTYILEFAEVSEALVLPAYDWWLLDDVVLRMRYKADGTFVGAEASRDVERLAQHRALRDAALAASTPLGEFWAAHPQYWRRNWLA